MQMIRFALLALFGSVAGDSNRGIATQVCKPSMYTTDGGGFCGGYVGGWYDGGMTISADFQYPGGPICTKPGSGNCNCPDCGQVSIFPNIQCKDWRCDDDRGYTDSSGACTVLDANGLPTPASTNVYYGCYKSTLPCDSSICNFGQNLVGCLRYNPGTCVECAPAPAGKYFAKKGSCTLNTCTEAGPGFYIATGCTTTADSTLVPCAQHPLNLGSINPGPRDVFYCPGNNLVVSLPANSHQVQNYSSYACDDGYYQSSTGACQQCPPGSCCLYGRQFICPESYYAHLFSQTSCTRCTVSCNNGELPYRCLNGSTTDTGCVPCGMCGYTVEQGHQCDEAFALTARLPVNCVPKSTSGTVAVCA